MKSPKILPWIARRAGISDALALKLWRRAAGEAEEITGHCDSSEYFGLAIERFIHLVEDESGVLVERETLLSADLAWLWRHQGRMSQLSLLAAQSTYRLWRSQWENFIAGQKHAA